MSGSVPRTTGLALATAAVVAAAGGSEAFWLAVPAAVLATAGAARWGEAAAAAAVVALAAAVPALVAESLGPLPSPLLAAVVIAGSVAIVRRVRTRLEAQLAHTASSALTDPLTGVANRRALLERVEYEVARHARTGHQFAIVALDLDGFKLVNDRFGHSAGDEVLADVAAALRAAVREQDTAARLGGDEFCVLAPETGTDGAERLAARVESAVSGATGGLRGLSASVGLAIYPADGDSAAAVLEAADAAQLAAKRARRAAAAPARRAA